MYFNCNVQQPIRNHRLQKVPSDIPLDAPRGRGVQTLMSMGMGGEASYSKATDAPSYDEGDYKVKPTVNHVLTILAAA